MSPNAFTAVVSAMLGGDKGGEAMPESPPFAIDRPTVWPISSTLQRNGTGPS